MSSSALRFHLSQLSSEMSVSVSLPLPLLCLYLCLSLYLPFSLYLCKFLISLSLSGTLYLYTTCMHACVGVSVPSYLCLSLYVSASVSLSVFLSPVISLPLFISASAFFSVSLFLHLCLFLFLSRSPSISHPVPPPATTTQPKWAEGLSPFPPNSSPLAAAYSFPILASPARPSWALEEGGQGGREGSLVGPPLFAFPGWEAGPVWAF